MTILVLEVLHLLRINVSLVLLLSKLANALVGLPPSAMELDDPWCRVMDSTRQRLDVGGVHHDGLKLLRGVEGELHVVLNLDGLSGGDVMFQHVVGRNGCVVKLFLEVSTARVCG